jgi:hypothetical protein
MKLKEKFEQYAKEEIWRTRNYNAEECELIAEEFAIGFKNFCDEKYHYNIEELSTKELLEIYKKDKGL